MVLVLLSAALTLAIANLWIQIQLKRQIRQTFEDTLENWKQKEREKIEAAMENLPSFVERAQAYCADNPVMRGWGN